MRRHIPLMVITFVLLGAAVHAGGQIFGIGGGKKPEFKPFQSPSQRFTVEYPSRDWEVQAGGTTSVIFTQKKSEAMVSIEYATLAAALEPSEIDQTTASYEINHVKSQMPKAEGFKPEIKDDAKRRIIVIEYNRPAIKGGMERVRQYSYIVGKDVYRIICSAVPAQFAKYEPVFTHVLASFKVAGTQP